MLHRIRSRYRTMGNGPWLFASVIGAALIITPMAFAFGEGTPILGGKRSPSQDTRKALTSETQIIADLDVVLDESGFANYGQYSTDQYFNTTVQWALYIQSQLKGFMDVNEWHESQQLTNAEIDYALATYAIIKEQAALVYASPYGQYGEEHYLMQYTAKIGPPCNEFYGGPSYLGLGRYAYYRQYRMALALVNTSPSVTYVVKLPQKSYTDIASGATVTSPLSLPPHSGFLLSTPGRGCGGSVH